ncbi:MAG: MarR family winged helix-turn-helix transcriptional regulator [Oscillospiraceae bacterium]|nr:MarR family winged helix-turn-helix transcriptional regulator [Oscillospiraceae bacterium]
MDYKALAAEFMESFFILNHTRPQRRMRECMQGEAFVIQFLSHAQRPVIPSEISATMGISSARIAAALGSLENKGLVTRRINPSDRRRILVELTGEGEAMAKEHHQMVLEHMTKMLSLLDETDATEYVRLTGKLAERISESGEFTISGPPLPKQQETT